MLLYRQLLSSCRIRKLTDEKKHSPSPGTLSTVKCLVQDLSNVPTPTRCFRGGGISSLGAGFPTKRPIVTIGSFQGATTPGVVDKGRGRPPCSLTVGGFSPPGTTEEDRPSHSLSLRPVKGRGSPLEQFEMSSPPRAVEASMLSVRPSGLLSSPLGLSGESGTVMNVSDECGVGVSLGVS